MEKRRSGGLLLRILRIVLCTALVAMSCYAAQGPWVEVTGSKLSDVVKTYQTDMKTIRDTGVTGIFAGTDLETFGSALDKVAESLSDESLTLEEVQKDAGEASTICTMAVKYGKIFNVADTDQYQQYAVTLTYVAQILSYLRSAVTILALVAVILGLFGSSIGLFFYALLSLVMSVGTEVLLQREEMLSQNFALATDAWIFALCAVAAFVAGVLLNRLRKRA